MEGLRFFYKEQYSFLKGKSITDAILRFTDEVYESFNNKKTIISVFSDLSKAFDTVDHSILWKNLDYCGIRGQLLGWCKSYLSDLCQYVSVFGCQSEQCPFFEEYRKALSLSSTVPNLH